MHVFMCVSCAEKKQDSDNHQGGCRRVQNTPSLTQDGDGCHRADEGGGGEESRFAGGTQQPECLHVEDEAQPVTDEPEKQSCQNDSPGWPAFD